MKKILLSLLLVLYLSGVAQSSIKYSKAKVTYNTPENFQKLVQLGISVDHGQRKHGVFIISDFSEEEISKIRKAGIQLDILIDDVVADFLKRNEKAKTQKQVKNLTCPSDNGTTIEYPTPTNFELGSMGGYLTYHEMLDNLDAMRNQYPNLISTRADIGTFVTNGTADNSVSPSIGGNTIQWVRISDNPDTDESGEPEILYDAIHHAREPACLSQLIYYMWYLLENYSTDADIKQIVDNTEMYFVPVINPDGYLYNQKTNPTGGGLWRKNRFNASGNNGGVDNNRNYSHYTNGSIATATWSGPGSSSNPNSETYHGTSEFSEVENQAMKWFTEQHDFVIALNNHTFGELLYFPYSYADVPTPDETIFLTVGAELTSQNGYTELRDFPFSGDSDDFMYGGTTQPHNKIFSFTPEVGDSFWPASNQIDRICKEMMYLNITAAKLTHNFSKIESNQSVFTGDDLSYEANYSLTRLGLTGNGDFTVSIIPISSNIISVGTPKNYANLTLGTTIDDFITINLDSSISIGDEILYTIEVDGGTIKESIDIINRFGSLQTIVNNDASSLTDFTGNGWSTTTSTFVSANSSITESPNGNYLANQNKAIELTNPIDLTQAGAANIQFYARWDIENNWDYAQFEVSVDNGNSWIPQCGKYSNSGSSNAGQPTGEPLYDGTQIDWVLEEINLSDYLGESIKVRFQFVSDSGVQEDGFYFDDLKVNVIDQGVLSNPDFIKDNFSIFPNPANNILRIQTETQEKYEVIIRNMQGQEVVKPHNLLGNEEIDISKLSAGLYFITITSGKNQSTLKVLKR